MQKALDYAYTHTPDDGVTDAYQKQVPSKGEIPTPDEGDSVMLENKGKQLAQVLFVSSKALKKPVAWGGPIVMNSQEELKRAFEDLRQGVFLRDGIDYSDK